MDRVPDFGKALLPLTFVFLASSCFAFSLEDTKFKGDLRLRYQYDHVELADSSAQRHRARGRLRFGFETKVHQQVSIGLRLASGQTDNRSTNQTYANFFTTTEVRLDRAYATWAASDALEFLFGKYSKAFLIGDDLIWDSDINFEGASALWEREPRRFLGGIANVGFFLLDEDKTGSRDRYMFYFQPGLSFSNSGSFSGTLGIAYYGFEHVKGMEPDDDLSAGSNTRIDGRLVYDYDSWNPSLVMTYATGGSNAPGLMITLLGDYIYNLDSEDSGFLVGVKAGHPSAGQKASWRMYYNFRRLERDAFLDMFPDSDFYGGATNVRGHEFLFQYAVAENVIMGLDYYLAEKIEGDKDPLNTFQFDCEFKF